MSDSLCLRLRLCLCLCLDGKWRRNFAASAKCERGKEMEISNRDGGKSGELKPCLLVRAGQFDGVSARTAATARNSPLRFLRIGRPPDHVDRHFD